MAPECGRGREGTTGRLSVPETRAAGPEGCKTTGLRGGRDTQRQRPGETQTKQDSAGSRRRRLWRTRRTEATTSGAVSIPAPRASALPLQCRGASDRLSPGPNLPRPAPSSSHGLTLACPPATAAAQPSKPEAASRHRPWVSPHPARERGAGSWPWC